MPRQKNLQFDFMRQQTRSDFGGSLLKKSHAKRSRPFSTKRAMHVVMRSSLARGHFSLRYSNHVTEVEQIVRNQAKKAGVRLYRYANSGNHLHLLILVPHSSSLRRFLRAVSGLIARLVMNTERGAPLPESVRFWDQRPFTRIVTWGREYAGVARYLLQNTLEALGFIPYQPRLQSLAKMRPQVLMGHFG